MKTKIYELIDVNKEACIVGVLSIYRDDIDRHVVLELKIDGIENLLRVTAGHYFPALLELRKQLELNDLLLKCNGSAENIYPSPMQVSFGGTRAYILSLGEQASLEHVVDIFDYDANFKTVTINDQQVFYEKWIESLRAK